MLVDLSRGPPTPDWSLTYPQLIGAAPPLMVLTRSCRAATTTAPAHRALPDRDGRRRPRSARQERGDLLGIPATGSRSSCRW